MELMENGRRASQAILHQNSTFLYLKLPLLRMEKSPTEDLWP